MKKQSFFAGSLLLLSSAVITKLIGALFKIPLTNILGGEGMGYFGCAYGLFLPIYAICSTGLATAASKLTAESAALRNYADVRRIRQTSILCFSVGGLLLGGLLALLAKPFSEYAAGCPQAFPAVLMLAPSVFFGCMLAVYRGCCEGCGNMLPTAVSQVIEAVVKLVCGLVLCRMAIDYYDDIASAFRGFSREALAAAGAVLGVTLSAGAGALFMALGAREKPVNKTDVMMSRRGIISALFRIIIPVALGSLVTNLTSVIDLVTIIRILTRSYILMGLSSEQAAASAGFIFGSFTGLAITIFNLVPSVTNMLGKSVLPAVASARAEGSREKTESALRSAITLTGCIAIPCGVGISVTADEILRFLFPQRTREIAACGDSLHVLGIAVIFLALSFPLFSALQGAGRADIPVKLMLAGAGVKLAGNLLLLPLPSLGITGAALSTLLCYALIFVLCIVFLGRVTGVKMCPARWLSRVAVSGVLCAAAAYAVSFAGGGLLLAISVGGAVYASAMLLSGGARELRALAA